MKSITIEYENPLLSPFNGKEHKKLKCIIYETTKISDLIPEITATFSINLSDYFLVYDPNYKAPYEIPLQLKGNIIEESDIIINKVQPNSTLYLVKKNKFEVPLVV